MKVLVTGGGGFLGCRIVKLLQERNIEVRSIGRQKQPVLKSLGVEVLTGDISYHEDAKKAVQGVDAVFHVAGRACHDMSYQDYYNTNVVGTKNIISACRKHGVGKVVFTSSPSVVFNGEALSGNDENLPYNKNYFWYYSSTKAIAEEHVLKNNDENLKTVAVRPHLLLGVGDPHLMPTLLRQAKDGKLKIVGDGRNLVDITFVNNAAYAHVLAFDALETGKACGKAYFIGQERPVNLWDFINDIFRRLGLPEIHDKVSFRTAYCLGFLIENFYKIFCRKSVPPMTRAVAVALSKNHYFSHENAKKDLGYMPQTTIESCVDEWVESLKWQMKQLNMV